MIAIRLFLLVSLLALAAALAYPAGAAMPLRGALPGATKESATRSVPALLTTRDVAQAPR